jgi:hypothetical protein
MAYEHQPGKGTLGKAKTKTKDTSPDMTGKIKWLDGQEYWISAWVKKASNGGEFFSLSIGQPVQPAGEVYSAAHQPFPAKPQYQNAVTGYADPSHAQAKANGYQPEGRDLDADIPF